MTKVGLNLSLQSFLSLPQRELVLSICQVDNNWAAQTSMVIGVGRHRTAKLCSQRLVNVSERQILFIRLGLPFLPRIRSLREWT